MRQTNSQQEPIQLELLRKSLQGWESALPVVHSSDWTTEQVETRFGISRQELYRIKSKPYNWRSSIFVFLHVRKNKWLVYSLKPFLPSE
ncbi:MAG: hypothetical protein M3O33_18305 [Cyanobacteriota bacterium]|nr:hypothetical protein [Cyanobacteriota bacterium]